VTAGTALTKNFPPILYFLSQSPTLPVYYVIPNTEDLEYCLQDRLSHKKKDEKKNFFHSYPQEDRKASFLPKINI